MQLGLEWNTNEISYARRSVRAYLLSLAATWRQTGSGWDKMLHSRPERTAVWLDYWLKSLTKVNTLFALFNIIIAGYIAIYQVQISRAMRSTVGQLTQVKWSAHRVPLGKPACY